MITKTDHISKRLRMKQIAKSWENPRSFHASTITNLVISACEEAGSSLATTVYYTVISEDFDRLVDISIDPSDYTCASEYYKDAQIIALIKKYPFWNIETDPLKNAIETFIACEVKCQRTNDLIFSGSLRNDPVVSSVLHYAQRFIAKVLGVCPDVTDLSFQFGPGSTFSIPNKNATAANKLCSTLDVTTNCYGLARKILLDCPGYATDLDHFDPRPGFSVLQRVKRIHGDRLAFVPKTAKTHRPIAITGFLNSVIQKGIGISIRERLRPYVDLRSAQFKHRRLARQASIDGKLATIDLKSASDTIAYALVLDLLPQSWFSLLDSSRSKFYSYGDKWYSYHKFSAMGNAYTFELETLIFYALTHSVCHHMGVKGEISVFGDDIIAPNQCYELLTKVLTACGFEVNSEKSFSHGSFRESCGGDYYNGIDVRPFYFKRAVTYQSLFLFHNYFVRSGNRYVFPKTFQLIRRIIGRVTCSDFRGPNVEGDGHLIDDTLPLCSFPRIVSKRYRNKRLRNIKDYRVSLLLYRQYLRGISATDEDKFIFSSEKATRHYVSLHRHI